MRKLNLVGASILGHFQKLDLTYDSNNVGLYVLSLGYESFQRRLASFASRIEPDVSFTCSHWGMSHFNEDYLVIQRS